MLCHMSSPEQSPIKQDRYDVVIAGARCSGASTAMLLARQGLRVLVVDPTEHGSDTLSTHALMRGGVLQLHRWGVLDAVRAAGTPAIRKTTFHYGEEATEVMIKPRDGVDALYAPRRTVLDTVLVDAALSAGAEVAHGRSVVGLLGDPQERIRGVRITGVDKSVTEVAADLVIGADGVRSRPRSQRATPPSQAAASAPRAADRRPLSPRWLLRPARPRTNCRNLRGRKPAGWSERADT